MKLQITLSEKQLERMEKALDFYSRVLCGQLEEVSRVIQFADFTRPILTNSEEHASVRAATETLKYRLFPEIYPAAFSVCNTERLPSIAAITYDISQCIRKLREDMKDKTSKKDKDVFKTSKEELPIIKMLEA